MHVYMQISFVMSQPPSQPPPAVPPVPPEPPIPFIFVPVECSYCLSDPYFGLDPPRPIEFRCSLCLKFVCAFHMRRHVLEQNFAECPVIAELRVSEPVESTE